MKSCQGYSLTQHFHAEDAGENWESENNEFFPKGKYLSISLEAVFQLSCSTSRLAFLSLLSQYLTEVHVISCPVLCTDLAVALGNYGNSNKGVYFETHAKGGRN